METRELESVLVPRGVLKSVPINVQDPALRGEIPLQLNNYIKNNGNSYSKGMTSYLVDDNLLFSAHLG